MKPKKGSQANTDRKAVERGDVRLVEDGEIWRAKSDGGPSEYKVIYEPTGRMINGEPEVQVSCNCMAGQYGTTCKHIRRANLAREQNAGRS